jgi:hypothetical protein
MDEDVKGPRPIPKHMERAPSDNDRIVLRPDLADNLAFQLEEVPVVYRAL